MIYAISHTARRLGRHAAHHAQHHWRSLVRHGRRLWSAHREQVSSNRSYLRALGALLVSLLVQDNVHDLLSALIAGLLAVYAATRRAVDRFTDRDEPDGWETA